MDDLGMTRLGVAALAGDTKKVKELLATEDAFERDVYGNTVAHYAAIAKDQGIDVNELFSGHIEVMDIPNKNKQLPKDILGGAKLIRTDPYECACEKCPSREISDFLDQRPVTCYLYECKAYELPGISPLNKSILKMASGITDWVTQNNPDAIASKDIFGNNACHYAAYRDCKGMMDMLLRRCPDQSVMQAVNNMGQRPIDIVKTGELKIADGVTDACRVYKVEPGCDDCSLKSPKCQPCE